MGQRVKRSTAVSRYLNPFDLGKVTKSRFKCSNRRFGTAKSPIGGTTCRVTLACWQCKHSRAHFEQSSLIEGHITLLDTVCLVLSTPGCPSPCRTSNMRRRRAKGMYGRAGPLLMSTMMLFSPMSTFFQFRPDRESCLRRWKSGSRGCCRATSVQSIPRSPMAATTCWKSSREASRFDEQFDGATAADMAEDAGTLDWDGREY